ncbi:hypothetical protein DICPUDRAFT_46126 [Dictyostelium purpureum]|uniref:N-acetyl-D-glucosamine kinase n=1 Tax=Dictyostelium purpureum TaxID=5786 RepID=F0ZDL1_DICPU|nr:uncharacterized protein DICPUDRAFT_46126 [Dictyostelium purpureum]EGC37958.1 hypothetical protein DICPUDRAFT_46126 [Dictyostelium purpureum]|eukprot:XP_003285529.1 hypothetical protein DICPUDRAFT_46126 [Dictyostelium purpureum]
MVKEVFIGVDGGGTKTLTLAVNNEGKELSRHVSPCSNYHSVGEDLAKASIYEGIRFVLNQIKRENEDKEEDVQVKSICLGMSGVDREEDKKMVIGWISELLGPNVPCKIYNDAIIALASGTDGHLFGIVVICGTGCISLGFNKDGQTTRSAGWGPLLGDYGSGYQIGYDILRHVLRAKDETGPKTSLTKVLLERLNLTKEDSLISWAYDPKNQNWQKFAQLSTLAFEQANAGDEIAILILNDAANALFEYISSIVKKLNLANEPFPLIFAGGNIERKSMFSDLLIEKIKAAYPNADIKIPNREPVFGAALLALNNN